MEYSVSKALEILENTPKVLDALLNNLSHEWICNNEGESTWSPFDILGHLIHGEKTDWMERTHIILSGSGNKTFEPFDRFAQFKASKEKTLLQLLKEFEHLRMENLQRLKAFRLKDHQLDLKGIHPEFGQVTLRQLLATWVTHDLGHIAQIVRVMAKQYKDEVGPWQAYIPILNR